MPQPGPFPVSVEHPSSIHKDPSAATVLPERVWQECILGGPPGSSSQNQQCSSGSSGSSGQERQNSPHDSSGQWDFMDPLKRANCTCSK